MRNNSYIKSIALIFAAIFCLCSCAQKGNDKLKEAYEAVASANKTTDKQISLPFETKSSSATSATTTTAPKEELTNPVCLEYFLWDNYEKTYTDGSESITFAYQEPDDGTSLRSTYPDIQYIANYRPGTELHFRVYKDREEAIARGVKIKFEANDMIFSGGTGSNPKYTGLINGIGYYTGIEWVYDGSLVEERFDIWFENSAVIGMNPYIKVTISTDGYKNKTFNIKVNRSDYYRIVGDGSFYAGFTQVFEGEENAEPDEFTPRITLNSDKTFSFVCNHLNGMETYIGKWYYCVINDSIYEVTLWVDTNDRYMPVSDDIMNTSITLKFESGKKYAEYSDDSYECYGYLVFGESSMPNSRFHIDYLEPVF